MALLRLVQCTMVLVAVLWAGPATAAYDTRSVTIGGISYDYAVIAPRHDHRDPADGDPAAGDPIGSELPIVLFLHGAGERGHDLDLAMSVGLPALLDHQSEFPAIYVVPQVDGSSWWTDPIYMEVAIQALLQTRSRFGANPERTYVTGISMGGHGALHLAARHPDLFAGVVSICARIGRPQYLPAVTHIESDIHVIAHQLQEIPLWLFHGDRDPIVPVSNARDLNRLLSIHRSPVRYTEVADGEHTIWDEVLNRRETVAWLFAQSLHGTIVVRDSQLREPQVLAEVLAEATRVRDSVSTSTGDDSVRRRSVVAEGALLRRRVMAD